MFTQRSSMTVAGALVGHRGRPPPHPARARTLPELCGRTFEAGSQEGKAASHRSPPFLNTDKAAGRVLVSDTGGPRALVLGPAVRD